VPVCPFQHFALDFVTHLPVTARGYDAILTVVDRFSKLVVLIPCSVDIDAATTAQLFFDNVVCKYGMPGKLISDRDVRFNSLFWRALCGIIQCRINMSIAYHPQTDGQSERFNRSIEQVLRCYCSPRQEDWDLCL
jgi:transposase InsO family protein